MRPSRIFSWSIGRTPIGRFQPCASFGFFQIDHLFFTKITFFDTCQKTLSTPPLLPCFLLIARTLIPCTVLGAASRSRSSVLVFRDARWVFVRMPAWPLAGTQIEKHAAAPSRRWPDCLPSQTIHFHLLQMVHGTLSSPIISLLLAQLTLIICTWSPFFHYSIYPV